MLTTILLKPARGISPAMERVAERFPVGLAYNLTMSAAHTRSTYAVRPATPEDAPACGRICYEAFLKINTDHNFLPELPSADVGAGMMAHMFAHPGF